MDKGGKAANSDGGSKPLTLFRSLYSEFLQRITGVAEVFKTMGQYLNITTHVGAISVTYMYMVAMHSVSTT